MMTRVHRLSAQDIMILSKSLFSKNSTEKLIDLSTIQKFFDASQFGLSGEEIKDVELTLLLLASAHKVGNKLFNDARKLLNLCGFLSSNKGNSVQRTVHYFTKALQEKITQETGSASSKGSELSNERKLLCPTEMAVGVDPPIISCCLQLPCIQLVLFSGIQVVIDSLGSAEKVHFVDFGIKTGGHCTVLMQALANRQNCPIELLKITGVGVIASRQRIEDAGKSLACFAQTLDIPFSFKTTTVTNIKELEEDMFDTDDDEVVAIFLPNILRFIKAQDCLQHLLKLLSRLNPCVMVIIEPELNHDFPEFLEKFVEVLLYFSTCYDGVEGCINQNDPNRISLESCIGQEIKDIIATKDEEKIFEHMKIDEWRNFFTKFGMEEREVSIAAFDLAELLLKKFPAGESCLLVRNGKSLMTGWKEIPLLSLSAWKFHPQKLIKNYTRKHLKPVNLQLP